MAKKAARAAKRSVPRPRVPPPGRRPPPARPPRARPRRRKAASRKTATPPAGAAGAQRAAADKYVYSWGAGKADGNGSMKPLLGGKGANLAEMARIGLPVPPGFTITTEVCTYFYDNKRTYPAVARRRRFAAGIAKIEKIMGVQVR